MRRLSPGGAKLGQVRWTSALPADMSKRIDIGGDVAGIGVAVGDHARAHVEIHGDVHVERAPDHDAVDGACGRDLGADDLAYARSVTAQLTSSALLAYSGHTPSSVRIPLK